MLARAEPVPDVFAGLPRGHYRLLYADPAWHFNAGPSRHAANHYRTMRLADILALPVGDLAHPDGARLAMWITMPFLHRLPEVLAAWRFRYSTARVWIKLWPKEDEMFIYPSSLARGTGYEVIGNAELLVIAKRGKPPPIIGQKPASAFFARRREHSRKPDMVRDELTRTFEGPRLELFARSQHDGWDAWGDQVGKFGGSP